MFGLQKTKDGKLANVSLENVDGLLAQVTEPADSIDAKYYISQAYAESYQTIHKSSFKNELSFIEVSPKEDISIGSHFEKMMRMYHLNRINDIFKIDLFTFCNSELDKIESMVRFAESINKSPEVKNAENTVNQVQQQISQLNREMPPGIKK